MCGLNPLLSDQGSHFKNSAIEDLRHSQRAYHHFTAARYPWAKEVVSKELLRVFRALASELRIHLRDWPRLCFLGAIRPKPVSVAVLGGEAPVSVMTGMARCNSAKAIALPSCSFPTMTLKRIQELQVLEFEDLRDSVANMHRIYAFNARPASKCGACSSEWSEWSQNGTIQYW